MTGRRVRADLQTKPTTKDSQMMLAGVRVVEIGQALAAPFAAEILADLGADVIKVEKPDGGDDARHWGAAIWGDDAPMFH
jgi:crotonobetainyl-CoA:carnitine CoA-transferase CaiB-like acyl-CoA transferase